MQHANIILSRKTKGTAYEGFVLPEPDEDFLDEDISEWNKRGYIPRSSVPNEKAFGKKPTQQEHDAMYARANEIVKWIDAFDDEGHEGRSEEEMREYYTRYAEWAKLNKQIWHFKLIARSHIVYITDKMMRGMEKAIEEQPDNYDLLESYESMKENYLTLVNEFKDEFAKN